MFVSNFQQEDDFFTFQFFDKRVSGFRLPFQGTFLSTLSTNNYLRPYHNGFTHRGLITEINIIRLGYYLDRGYPWNFWSHQILFSKHESYPL